MSRLNKIVFKEQSNTKHTEFCENAVHVKYLAQCGLYQGLNNNNNNNNNIIIILLLLLIKY